MLKFVDPYPSLASVPEVEMDLFEKICFSAPLEHLDPSKHFTCARALAEAAVKVFGSGLQIRMGTHLGFMHAWLETPSGHLIDLLPIGIMSGPIFVNSDRLGPRRFYRILGRDDLKHCLSADDHPEDYEVLVDVFVDDMRTPCP